MGTLSAVIPVIDTLEEMGDLPACEMELARQLAPCHLFRESIVSHHLSHPPGKQRLWTVWDIIPRVGRDCSMPHLIDDRLTTPPRVTETTNGEAPVRLAHVRNSFC